MFSVNCLKSKRGLIKTLKKREPPRFVNSLARKARLALLLLFASLAAAGGLFLHQLLGDLPPVDSVAERLHTPSIRIVDRHGILLYEILPENEGRHTVVQIGRAHV